MFCVNAFPSCFPIDQIRLCVALIQCQQLRCICHWAESLMHHCIIQCSESWCNVAFLHCALFSDCIIKFDSAVQMQYCILEQGVILHCALCSVVLCRLQCTVAVTLVSRELISKLAPSHEFEGAVNMLQWPLQSSEASGWVRVIQWRLNCPYTAEVVKGANC